MKTLPTDVEDLQNLVRTMLLEISELKTEVGRLKEENGELKRQLQQTSHNSHKAPSSDVYKKAKVKKPKAKAKVGIPEEKKAKGGQVGHVGKTLEQVSETELDEVIKHVPSACVCCGKTFEESDLQLLSRRQVFELPEVRLKVCEHQVYKGSCCDQTQQGAYPETVRQPVQYGPRVAAWLTVLSIDYRLPLQRISQLFADSYGYAINSNTLLTKLSQGYDLLAESEQQIKANLKEAAVVHVDETSLKVEGKRRWLHCASTAEVTYLYVHDKRGGEALRADASVMADITGYAVHDCWSSYFTFSCHHALCGAHLLRELTALIETGSTWAGQMHTFLLRLYRYTKRMTQAIAQAHHDTVITRFQTILDAAEAEEPPPKPSKGRLKRSVGRNLFERLKKYQPAVLAFAFNPDVPFTNNQAERDLRPAKIKQKVSGCFRTSRGADIYARIQSVIATLRKQDCNPFDALKDLFASSSLAKNLITVNA